MWEGLRTLKVKCHKWGGYASTSLWLPCQWHNIHIYLKCVRVVEINGRISNLTINLEHHQKIYWPVVQNVWLLFIIHMILIQKWCKQFNMEQHMEHIYIYTGPWEELITHTHHTHTQCNPINCIAIKKWRTSCILMMHYPVFGYLHSFEQQKSIRLGKETWRVNRHLNAVYKNQK